MSCRSNRPVSISLVLPLTESMLRFGVNKMCVYCWEMLVSIMLAATVQFILKQNLSGCFREMNNGAVTDIFHPQILLLCAVHCFLSCLDISNRQTDIRFELTANIHPRSTHTTCIFIFCSLWQSLKPSWTSVTHHLFPSTSCFCASSETPNATVHEYMQIYESYYASDLPLVQTVSFNGQFAIELHNVWCVIDSFDIWIV